MSSQLSLTELCSIASADARFYCVTDDPQGATNPELVIAQTICEALVEVQPEDSAATAVNLSLLLAGDHSQQRPPLAIGDMKDLSNLYLDNTLPERLRFGALAVLACCATAYKPSSASDNGTLDALGSASYEALRLLGGEEKKGAERFASLLTQIIYDAPDDLVDDASLLFESAAQIEMTELLDENPEITGNGRNVREVDTANLTLLSKLAWLDPESLPKKYFGEDIQVEDRTVAILCNLTAYNRRTERFAKDLAKEDKYSQAWGYARLSVARLTQALFQMRLQGIDPPIFFSGNRSNNENFIRSYYTLIGHQDGTPIYGVVGMVRTTNKQKQLLKLFNVSGAK